MAARDPEGCVLATTHSGDIVSPTPLTSLDFGTLPFHSHPTANVPRLVHLFGLPGTKDLSSLTLSCYAQATCACVFLFSLPHQAPCPIPCHNENLL